MKRALKAALKKAGIDQVVKSDPNREYRGGYVRITDGFGVNGVYDGRDTDNSRVALSTFAVVKRVLYTERCDLFRVVEEIGKIREFLRVNGHPDVYNGSAKFKFVESLHYKPAKKD